MKVKHIYLTALAAVCLALSACSIPRMVLNHENRVDETYATRGLVRVGLFEDRRPEEERIEGRTAMNTLSPQIWSGETDPQMMAQAARFNAEKGAQIIDINMGCPAKKVCNVLAGSALMRDEKLVADILEAVVNAVDIPITLKIRTGWDKDNVNAPTVARIAEDAGIQSLAIHGRTRADQYKGDAEYDTIAEVKQRLNIPVIANGDITTPEKAKYVLEYTQADAVMIGRAAQGRPWIFREIDHYLKTGEHLADPSMIEVRDILVGHLHNLYEFYGEYAGVRIARKHISWYSKGQRHGAAFRQTVNHVDSKAEQLDLTYQFFEQLITTGELAA